MSLCLSEIFSRLIGHPNLARVRFVGFILSPMGMLMIAPAHKDNGWRIRLECDKMIMRLILFTKKSHASSAAIIG